MNSSIPNCAKCNKPVDYLERAYNVDRDEFIFYVSCHGEIQSFSVTGETLMTAKDIQTAQAFSNSCPKALEGK